MPRFHILLAAGLVLLVLSGTTRADVIGTLILDAKDVHVALDRIGFPAAPQNFPAGVTVGAGSTLTFSGGSLTAGEDVLINGGADFPFSSALPALFITFPNHSALEFELTGITKSAATSDCKDATSAGDMCSPNSTDANQAKNFTIKNDGNGSSDITINLAGLVTDNGSFAGARAWTGKFTMTIAQTPDTLANFTFCPGYDALNICTQTGNFVPLDVEGSISIGTFNVPDPRVPTPEPTTLALFASGLGIALIRRRRRVS